VDAQGLRRIASGRYDDFVAVLEEMVNVDCGSYSPAGVNFIADMCEARLRDHGWEVEASACRSTAAAPGDLVIGRLRGAGGPNVLLVGHMDTVFDDGTVAERPFQIDGDMARGPGVSDMKGGLLTGFFAVEVLQEAGFDGFGTISYVCNPDEEIGSPFSGPVIRELAPLHDVAFVLEGARANGDIVSARKGVTDYRIVIHGRAAHAGVEPEKGRNAVLEAAHAIVALQGLNSRWPGVTMNVGVVPGHAHERRGRTRGSDDLIAGARDAGTAKPRSNGCGHVVPDVTTEVLGNGWHRPWRRKVRRLVDIAVVAAELGFELRDAATGGASDANTTSAAGTPTIDGLGPVGGDDHAPAEWLDLTSVVPRVTLLAGIISRT
jgi:glutamate carboxypeptidase